MKPLDGECHRAETMAVLVPVGLQRDRYSVNIS